MPNPQPDLSLYLHIPFCTHRCAYCDFNTYAGQEELIPAYVKALCEEIKFTGTRFPQEGRVHTIFFGGGTPSLLSPDQFDAVLKAIRDHFTLTEDPEITIEANPGTVSDEALAALRSLGINRLSYGVQSANAEELHMLERAHTFWDVIEAVRTARKAGFENINLDLIYGLPEQTLSTWQTTVRRVLALHPEHISAYALTLEHGTPFGRWAARGLLPLPDPDLAAEMYEWLSEMLETHGFAQYEISNWAMDGQRSNVNNGLRPSTFEDAKMTPAFACQHNLQYWRGLPYLAFGAGAHGYASGYRFSNVLRIKTYIDRLTNVDSPISNLGFPLSPAVVNQHRQSLQDDMSEYMMTALRLTEEGASTADFQARFGKPVYEVYGKEIEELCRLGLIEQICGGRIRITRRARLLANHVFMRFIG